MVKDHSDSERGNQLPPHGKEVFLFHEALNTFYSRLYDVRHMVKDHSDSERGNPLPPHGLLFPISSKGSFYMHHPTDRIIHTTAFVTPVMEHWLEREIAQWVHPMKDRSDDPSHHERTLLPRSYISLPAATWATLSYIYMYTHTHHPIDRIALTSAFCLTSHGRLVAMRDMSMGPPYALPKPIELFLVPASAPRLV